MGRFLAFVLLAVYRLDGMLVHRLDGTVCTGLDPVGMHVTRTPENSGPGSLRERLLDAAEQIVARHGVGNLTLDAVAHEAGVSKGGAALSFSLETGVDHGRG